MSANEAGRDELDGAVRPGSPGEPSAQDGAAGADGAAEAVEVDIATLMSERDEFRDIAMRLKADFENFRKRQAAQQGDEVDRATGRLVEALLPVLDACELAFTHGAAGIEPIWSSLIGALQRQGLEALDLQGKAFDPNEADAVVHEEGDGDTPMVAEVMRTGYRWKGKVLRPAMVKVKG